MKQAKGKLITFIFFALILTNVSGCALRSNSGLSRQENKFVGQWEFVGVTVKLPEPDGINNNGFVPFVGQIDVGPDHMFSGYFKPANSQDSSAMINGVWYLNEVAGLISIGFKIDRNSGFENFMFAFTEEHNSLFLNLKLSWFDLADEMSEQERSKLARDAEESITFTLRKISD